MIGRRFKRRRNCKNPVFPSSAAICKTVLPCVEERSKKDHDFRTNRNCFLKKGEKKKKKRKKEKNFRDQKKEERELDHHGQQYQDPFSGVC